MTSRRCSNPEIQRQAQDHYRPRSENAPVKEAASHREDVAQFQHIFRNVRDEADAMVKTLQGDMFGRTSREAMQLTMNLGSMLKGIGLTDQAAVGLSGEFAKMAVDIGSFMAKDPTAVMDAFQSALMGNTMALRTYGVFLTDAQLQEKMLQQSKEGLTFATEREAKAYSNIVAGEHAIQPGMTEQQAIDFIGSSPTRSHYQGGDQGYTNEQHVLIWEYKDQALMVVCVEEKVIRVRNMSGIYRNSRNRN